MSVPVKCFCTSSPNKHYNKQKHVVRSRKYGERKYLGTALITNEVQSEFMFMLQNFPPRAHHRHRNYTDN